jgi:hypothetical protein
VAVRVGAAPGTVFRICFIRKKVLALSDKVKAVRDYPTQRTSETFVGLTSFYRRLVPNVAARAKPLTELTRKDRQFVWGPCEQKAFEELVDMLCITPVLGYSNFDIPFIITADASKLAVAAILSHVPDGQEKPLAYGCR